MARPPVVFERALGRCSVSTRGWKLNPPRYARERNKTIGVLQSHSKFRDPPDDLSRVLMPAPVHTRESGPKGNQLPRCDERPGMLCHTFFCKEKKTESVE